MSTPTPTIRLRYRRDRNQWYADCYWPNDGHRERIKVCEGTPTDPNNGTPTPSRRVNEAFHLFKETLLPAVIQQHQIQKHSPKETRTYAQLDHLFDYYTETAMRISGASPKNIENHTITLMHFSDFAQRHGITRAEDITRALIDQWIVTLQKKPNQPNTIKTKLGILRAAINTAIKSDIIKENPLKNWPSVKTEDTEITPLEPEELAERLEAVKQHTPGYYNIITYIANTGNRPSDACDLRMKQFNPIHKTIERNQVKTKRLAQYQLNPTALEAIYNEINRHHPTGNQHIFLNIQGKPCTTESVRLNFQRAQQRAGFKRIENIKNLRHTFGYIMANYAKCPLGILQVLMGHSNIKITMGYTKNADAESYLADFNKITQKPQTTQTPPSNLVTKK